MPAHPLSGMSTGDDVQSRGEAGCGTSSEQWRLMESNVLSLEQTSRYLGVSQAALRTWKRDGKGPAFFRAGKLLRFRKSDLDLWIQE